MKFNRLGLAPAAVAVVVLLVGVSSVFGQTVPDFEDVPEGHVAEAAIEWAAQGGITQGVGDNRFGVGGTLTRYEMVTFLCRAFDPGSCLGGVRGSESFVDVPADHWANYSVGWAVNRGITTGVSATEFGGGQTLTREQMITFLYRAKGKPTGGSDGIDVFQDAPGRSHWASVPIGWAFDEGVTGGIAAGTFGFGTNVSREEMVLFLCRTVAPGTCQPSQQPLPSSVVPASTITEELPTVSKPATPRISYSTDDYELWVADADGTNRQKLADHGIESQWSPDGTRIAFINPNLDGLWVVNADGTNKVKLYEGRLYWSPDWGWSPDSSRIAYQTEDEVLWVVDVDGKNPNQLGRLGSIPFVSGWYYGWSPDGSRIVYRTDDRRLWVADADGTNKQQLTGHNGLRVQWSPDGSRIAFRTLDFVLWVADGDGTNKQQLASEGWRPRWSPDSTRLVYHAHGVVWVADADGTNKRQLASEGYSPHWSPDGTRIGYDHAYDGGGLWVLNADGSNIQQLTDSTLPTDADGIRLQWSPDGSRIAYRTFNTESVHWQRELWLADADGTNRELVADYAQYPVWSPDSTKIAYQHSGLWVVDADGTNKRQLTNDGLSSESWSWSPDGSRIAVIVGGLTGGELWLMDAGGTNKQKIADTWSRPVWSPHQ